MMMMHYEYPEPSLLCVQREVMGQAQVQQTGDEKDMWLQWGVYDTWFATIVLDIFSIKAL